MKPKKTIMDAHRGKKKDTVKIPKPTYKNLQLAKESAMHDAGGVMEGEFKRKSDGTYKTTKKDSLNYKEGYDYGVRNWKQGYGPGGEDHVFQKGRWEGQNVGKAINYRKPVKVSKSRIVIGAVPNVIGNILFKKNKKK